jgi:hypothetical protein
MSDIIEYEYKTKLIPEGKILNDIEKQSIDEIFLKGWEYVDSISQSVSEADNYSPKARGAILIIFKRKKNLSL